MSKTPLTPTEFYRILVSPPVNPKPYEGFKPTPAYLPGRLPIAVTAYHDDDGHIYERWLLSETDERWYRIEKWVFTRVSVAVKVQKAVTP
jgi:hypothetical protein